MNSSHEKSIELFTRACELMPGGVSSPVRAFRSVGGTPIYYRKAKGSRFFDEDGNEYVDYCMSWGPLILGHAHPAVVEAVRRTAADGLSFGACCRREIELAERVITAFPRMEQVRFVSSGTEAVMTAIRLARGVTNRPKILKFEGCYHGHSDAVLVRAGSGLATLGTSSSLGVPQAFAAETIVIPLDDDQALEQAFESFGDQLAAAIIEPLPANNGLLEQRPEWLLRLRQLTSDHGALLIFDEVISGFRGRFGGYGDGQVEIEADLITLGKIIGSGMPIGALVGPRNIMERLAPLGEVYQAGTLSGNPVGLAAGIATLDLLSTGGAYEKLEELGSRFDQRLAQEADGIDFLHWRRWGSLVWIHLAPEALPRRADAILPQAVERFNAIHGPLLRRGIYLPPSAFEVFFFSVAHTLEEVERLATEIVAAIRNG